MGSGQGQGLYPLLPLCSQRSHWQQARGPFPWASIWGESLQARWKGTAVITGPGRPCQRGRRLEGRRLEEGEGLALRGVLHGVAAPRPAGSCAWKTASMDLGNVMETSEAGSPDTG